MFAKEIPDFIVEVMEQIEIAIDRVAQKKIPQADRYKYVQYPEVVEIMLNVEAKIDDGTVEEAYENQTIWVKIPWQKKPS